MSRRNLVVLSVAALVATVFVAVPVGWAVQRHLGIQAVHEHPFFEVLDDRGWEVTHDRRFRAGPVDRLFLGGMIEHPYQREVHYRPPEPVAGDLHEVVEDVLFGVRGQPRFDAHALSWERQEVSGDAVRYIGRSGSSRGRLERVTVSVSSGEVHVRSFGR